MDTFFLYSVRDNHAKKKEMNFLQTMKELKGCTLLLQE